MEESKRPCISKIKICDSESNVSEYDIKDSDLRTLLGTLLQNAPEKDESSNKDS